MTDARFFRLKFDDAHLSNYQLVMILIKALARRWCAVWARPDGHFSLIQFDVLRHNHRLRVDFDDAEFGVDDFYLVRFPFRIGEFGAAQPRVHQFEHLVVGAVLKGEVGHIGNGAVDGHNRERNGLLHDRDVIR